MKVTIEALVELPIPASIRRAEGDRPGIVLAITKDRVVRDIGVVHEIAAQQRSPW